MLRFLAIFFSSTLVAATPDIVLITMDTTRADVLGVYGGEARTPAIDMLARQGVRYTNAISPAPITLPAHASILTGLEPPEHGVRENGTMRLDRSVLTVAEELKKRGYVTAAFVSSRVLDRRFGLDQGFDLYDDDLLAEQIGEYGYPERDAASTTARAVEWLKRPQKKPRFVWIHYYDPHSPYEGTRSGDHDRYLEEVERVDSSIAAVVAAAPRKHETAFVVVADHGESLGEHGEATHGVFLYRSVIRVPMIIRAPGVRPGVVEGVVSTRRIAPTVIAIGSPSRTRSNAMGEILPGTFGGANHYPVFSESTLPRSAYGWSELTSWTDTDVTYIEAPRPELYRSSDTGQSTNVAATDRDRLFSARRSVERYRAAMKKRASTPAPVDSALAESLRSLGYLSGSSASASSIDPKDGIHLLNEFELARREAAAGRFDTAKGRLSKLVAKNPTNVPFLTELASVTFRGGDRKEGVLLYRRAVSLNPKLDFLHLNLADALRESGAVEDAKREYTLALQLNPFSAAAVIRLADIALASGESLEALRLYDEAEQRGLASASILTRKGRLQLALGRKDDAERSARQALRLAPSWKPAQDLLADVRRVD